MTLEEQLKSLKISRQKLAKDIHVPVSLISAVLKSEEAITADVALRLGRYFGNGPEAWQKLALDAAAKRLKDELASIPIFTSVMKTKQEPKEEKRTKEQIRIWKEWLKKTKDSDYFYVKSGRFGEFLSELKSANLSHPTDELAKAAVTVGDIDAMRKLAAAGYKRWGVKKIGWNAFVTPCLDVVKFVVENGFDITEIGENWAGDYRQDHGHRTPLGIAAECGHADVVAYLLSIGADAKYINNRGFTPLHFAAFSQSLETVKLLVDAGADVNAVSRKVWILNARSVMDVMAENGFYEGMRYLESQGAELHNYHKEYRNLLQTVCDSDFRTGNIQETTSYLLDKGFDPFGTSKNYPSPVELAAKRNNIEAMRALIKHGVPLDKSPVLGKKNDKLLPLEIAAQNELSDEDHLIETLELISKHSLPLSKTYVLNCVAANVSNQPRARVCRYLLDKGCPVNTNWSRNDFTAGVVYRSPLHAITSTWGTDQRAEIVAMLLDAGADVNQKTPAGFTPLACAVCRPGGDIEEVISLLHKAGADFAVKTKRGLSILQIAQEHNAKPPVLELLKRLGAK